MSVYQTLAVGNRDAAFGILVSLFMAGGGFWIFKTVVRNRDREARIPLAEIINVNYERLSNPPRVTQLLRNASDFGQEITFMVQGKLFGSPARQMALELIGRIEALREEPA